MRVTTNSIMRNYNNSLSTSFNSLNMARQRVEDNQLFHRASEDPTGALRVSTITRRLLKLEDYNATVEDCIGRQDTADGVIQSIVSQVGAKLKEDGLAAINGASSPESKKTYATEFRQMQDSFLQLANSQYQDSYLFAGADGGKMPFTKDDDGTIRYRGINVTTGQWEGHSNEAGLKELERLTNEKLYVDIGTGLRVDTPNNIATNSDDINGASAYNKSLSGIDFLGFGSAGGEPPISKNILSLVGQMADELESPSFNEERFDKILDQLKETHGSMADFGSEVGVNQTFLDTTKKRLASDELTLAEQYESAAKIPAAQAITDFSYSQYCYNLVLKVGSSLLSNSFIDFMK